MSFKTRKPLISGTTIELVRTAARRYVLAGGSIFPSQDDADMDEHIGNVHAALHPRTEDHFERELKALKLPYDIHERLWDAAIGKVADETGAAFLFGAFVGVEMATLGRPHAEPTQAKGKKGGKR